MNDRSIRNPRACTIVPPYLLDTVAQRSGTGDLAGHARRTLDSHTALVRSTRARGARRAGSDQPKTPGEGPNRTVFSADHGTDLPGKRVRGEGDPASGDDAVDEAYTGLGATWQLYARAYDRDSVDGQGMPLHASVHYDRNYDNAFWNGDQLVFGDGDGKLFTRFTRDLTVVGHELSHGVVQYSAALEYKGQAGSLNESVCDAFGALTEQRDRDQTADEADWLIGAEILAPGVHGKALRSMKAPGTAYDDPQLGKDPQPATMSDYVETSEDDGGVHVNSGIPNHAFYLIATALGGKAWERAGRIWYAALTGGELESGANFAAFARVTIAAAKRLFGDASDEVAAVRDGWKGVQVDPAGGDGS